VILDTKKQMHLNNVRKANKAYREAKIGARALVKKRVEEELATYRSAMDMEVRLAVEAGVPKSVIAQEGMLTTNVRDVYTSLERTQHAHDALAEELERDPLAGRYEIDYDGSLVVTLTGQTFQEAAEAYADHEWSQTAAEADGVNSARFAIAERVDGSTYLDAITPISIERGGLHPVVMWMSQAQNEAEALGWLAQQRVLDPAA
jgi:hypothetical protein